MRLSSTPRKPLGGGGVNGGGGGGYVRIIGHGLERPQKIGPGPVTGGMMGRQQSLPVASRGRSQGLGAVSYAKTPVTQRKNEYSSKPSKSIGWKFLLASEVDDHWISRVHEQQDVMVKLLRDEADDKKLMEFVERLMSDKASSGIYRRKVLLNPIVSLSSLSTLFLMAYWVTTWMYRWQR